MIRYVLMPPDSPEPSIIYRSISQYVRDKGFKRHEVDRSIKKNKKHVSDLGTLWPVDMPDNEAHATRKGRSI